MHGLMLAAAALVCLIGASASAHHAAASHPSVEASDASRIAALVLPAPAPSNA